MNFEGLEAALDLQKRAYALLLWIGREASARPHLLDAEALGSSTLAAHWLTRNLNVFPTELRPHLDELHPFALMLTSFFNTSFHVKHSGTARRLVRGQNFKDRRNKKYATSRAENAAEELCRLAINAIAEEEGVPAPSGVVDELIQDDALNAAVSLWAYGCELVRRSQFATQGRLCISSGWNWMRTNANN